MDFTKEIEKQRAKTKKNKRSFYDHEPALNRKPHQHPNITKQSQSPVNLNQKLQTTLLGLKYKNRSNVFFVFFLAWLLLKNTLAFYITIPEVFYSGSISNLPLYLTGNLIIQILIIGGVVGFFFKKKLGAIALLIGLVLSLFLPFFMGHFYFGGPYIISLLIFLIYTKRMWKDLI